MTGLLVGAGIGDEDAHVYSESVRKGGTLVVVRVEPERYEDARAILAQSHATDMAVGVPNGIRTRVFTVKG